MYKQYFQLAREPFNITPDTRFLYMTDQHREAMNHMLFGIRQRKGFICITGEVGAGKTTLCRALLEQLEAHYRTALILNPVLTETQLLRAVVEEFGIRTKRKDRLGYLKLLNEFLLEVNSTGGDAVLIIDEAQDMPPKTLEMTRLLSNLETRSRKLLQIVMVAQPELRKILQRPSMRQLDQRITVRFHLNGMNSVDTDRYIHHRLSVAGRKDFRFAPGAVKEIHRFSRGIPRLVSAASDKALLAAFVYQTNVVNRRIARAAINDLKEAG